MLSPLEARADLSGWIGWGNVGERFGRSHDLLDRAPDQPGRPGFPVCRTIYEQLRRWLIVIRAPVGRFAAGHVVGGESNGEEGVGKKTDTMVTMSHANETPEYGIKGGGDRREEGSGGVLSSSRSVGNASGKELFMHNYHPAVDKRAVTNWFQGSPFCSMFNKSEFYL